MMITAERFPLLPSSAVDADISICEQHGEVIRDASALTIASYWMSPGVPCGALAELVHTGRADSDALTADIVHEVSTASSEWEASALRMLARWVDHKVVTAQAEDTYSKSFDVD
jgi:hypothetical protein